jgi:hypothetical protein
MSELAGLDELSQLQTVDVRAARPSNCVKIRLVNPHIPPFVRQHSYGPVFRNHAQR